MTGIVGVVLVGVVAVWVLSALIVAVVMTRALLGDPKVVVDDPWERHEAEGQRRLRERAHAERQDGPATAVRRPRPVPAASAEQPRIPRPRHAA